MSASHINPTPGAWKRPGPGVEPLHPRRVLASLRTLFLSEEPSASAPPIAHQPGTGVEPPAPGAHSGDPLAALRSFGFIDVTGFTALCDREGEHAAIASLTHFRALVRAVAVRRGVRVAKWLGDGVMLVGTEPGPILATVAEVVVRARAEGLETHAGVAAGPVLLFEGDDYIGRPVNLAARLCEAAEAGEILAAGLEEALPEWMRVAGRVTVRVNGVGDIDGILRVAVRSGVVASLAAPATVMPAGPPDGSWDDPPHDPAHDPAA